MGGGKKFQRKAPHSRSAARRRPFVKRSALTLSVVLAALLALLVGNTAGSLAGRLARGLALAAAAVLGALGQVTGIQGLDSLHNYTTPFEKAFGHRPQKSGCSYRHIVTPSRGSCQRLCGLSPLLCGTSFASHRTATQFSLPVVLFRATPQRVSHSSCSTAASSTRSPGARMGMPGG